MKKIIGLLISLVLIIVVAGPFASGFLLEVRVPQMINNINKQLPRSSVKLEKFHRGWFKSSVVILLKDNKTSINLTLDLTHGPLLITKGGLKFGLGSIDLTLFGTRINDKDIQFIKEIFARTQSIIILNFQKTLTVDIQLKKLLKPFKKGKFIIATINDFHYHLSMPLIDGVSQRAKASLRFEKIAVNYKSLNAVINQYDSRAVYHKSSKGAKTENVYLTLNSAKINYSTGVLSRQIMFKGIDFRSDVKIIADNIVMDLLFKVRAVEVPGFRPMSLHLPLRMSNFNEEGLAQYQKITGTYPLKPLELLKVITKIIAGKPLIEMNKGSLKVGGDTALMNFKLQGVPLSKGGIVNMFNYRKIIDLHADIEVPKTTLKELLKISSHLSSDLNKTDSEEKANSRIKLWLEQHLITEKPKSYGFELKIKESKLFMNAERKKFFLFP